MTHEVIMHALERLSASGTAPTVRAVQAVTGGSMRDVSRLLRELTTTETEEDMVALENTLLPDDEATLVPPADEEYGEDDTDDVPAIRRTPPPPPRRAGGAALCHLCGDLVPTAEVIVGILSLLPSVAGESEYACRPLHLPFHDACLRIYCQEWNSQHPDLIAQKAR